MMENRWGSVEFEGADELDVVQAVIARHRTRVWMKVVSIGKWFEMTKNKGGQKNVKFHLTKPLKAILRIKKAMKTSSVLYLMLLYLMNFWSVQSQAQPSVWPNSFLERQVFSNSSGSFESNNFSISWTVGEPVTETLQSDQLFLSQGFEQADPVVKHTVAVKEVQPEALGLRVYPNPAAATLTVELKQTDVVLLQLQLFDSMGRLLNNQKISTGSNSVDVHALPTGLYLLRFIRPETQECSTLKFQKI